MKKSISKLLILTSLIILSGCAASYRPINPPAINYNAHDLQDGIGFSYRYDVLREKGNRKYANKEHRKGVKLIAVKITNNTDSLIVVARDLTFYSGEYPVVPMEPMVIKETIKQIVPAYLPYLLFTFVNLTITKTTYYGSDVSVIPIGLGLGPGITLANMAISGSSNQNMLRELYEYNVLNSMIPPGETIYGIIGVHDFGYSPMSVKLKKNKLDI